MGVLMGIAGSIGINVGQNMQATALDQLPEELKSKPHKSKLWIWGMVIFVGFSLINFAALALVCERAGITFVGPTVEVRLMAPDCD